jgi:glycogen operon protein
VKLIAEPWDLGDGGYQVGNFPVGWTEWNGKYRDAIRRFWRGDGGAVSEFATRLCGSSDLYEHGSRLPSASINFVTAHDGFTLNDLVSYDGKHNEANQEENRDGESNNLSWNCGAEGPTQDQGVLELRERQKRNFLATLLLSQGVPMILFGDECRRTQRGNNNAYCQDNAISWFNWKLAAKHRELWRFVQSLVEFRKAEPSVRREEFLTGKPIRPGGLPDVSWYAPNGSSVNWGSAGHSLTCLLAAVQRQNGLARPNHHILLFCHGGFEPCRFTIPAIARGLHWKQFIDTNQPCPADVYPGLDGPKPPADGHLTLDSRSLVCYVAPDTL